MNALHEVQKYVTNDLRVLRQQYFPRMESFQYKGNNPKRGGSFEETRYRAPSLDFFNGCLFAGNVGGEKPSDYARSIHFLNLILQREGLKGTAFGFDVEPSTSADDRPDGNQINFQQFLDAVMKHSKEFLLLHVTDPYKTHAYEYATARSMEISEHARISGVVNPFLFDKNGNMYADNVDGYALMEAIEEKKPIAGSKILMIGAGGVGSSIALEALDRIGDGRIVILNRTVSRAYELSKRLRSYKDIDEKQLIVGGIDLLRKYATDADILISAVTENPFVNEDVASAFPEDAIFADVNYGKAAAILEIGKRTGHDSIDGGPMVYYGVERAARMAFERKLDRNIKYSTLAAVKQEAMG